ncbi:MAG: IS200/IS605 family transposase [Bacteroidota bacterium]
MEKRPAQTARETDIQTTGPASGPADQPDESAGAAAPRPVSSGVEARPASEAPGQESGVILEPVSPHPYGLTYACLLIPRFDTHYLKGDLIEYLREWMVRICISFNWQLDALNIQPEYMQWLLTVPAAVPPAQFIRAIRVHTSARIFAEFPKFKSENLSTDFWAPGHLVIVGNRPHSPHMINEFIRLTRQQQGIYRGRG